jgi:hypothetical protein
MIDRRALLVLFAAVPVLPATAAEGPAEIVAAIYKRIVPTFGPGNRKVHSAVTWSKKNRHHFYSAALVKAWDHADAITAKGDQNPPAADPITNSQDPMVAAYDVKVERQDAKTAIVIVHIGDKPGPVTPSDRGTIFYDMVFERGRWRIDDIRPGTGKEAWSLRREIVNHKG